QRTGEPADRGALRGGARRFSLAVLVPADPAGAAVDSVRRRLPQRRAHPGGLPPRSRALIVTFLAAPRSELLGAAGRPDVRILPHLLARALRRQGDDALVLEARRRRLEVAGQHPDRHRRRARAGVSWLWLQDEPSARRLEG